MVCGVARWCVVLSNEVCRAAGGGRVVVSVVVVSFEVKRIVMGAVVVTWDDV